MTLYIINSDYQSRIVALWVVPRRDERMPIFHPVLSFSACRSSRVHPLSLVCLPLATVNWIPVSTAELLLVYFKRVGEQRGGTLIHTHAKRLKHTVQCKMTSTLYTRGSERARACPTLASLRVLAMRITQNEPHATECSPGQSVMRRAVTTLQ